MIIYYMILFLFTAFGAVFLYYILKKFNNKKEKILKSISIGLGIIATITYMIGDSAIASTRGLNMYSPFDDNIAMTIIGLILVWFSYASILLIVLYPFFKINNIKNLLKFVAMPVLIMDILLFNVYSVSIIGSNAFDVFDIRMILIVLELAISFAYIAALFFNKDYFKLNKKEVKILLVSIIPILIAIIPGYMIQAFFGYTSNTHLKFKSLSFEHRMMIYFSIIIPVGIYYAFKNKDENTKRFAMIYLSIAALWSYMINYGFSTLANPLNWPIHLCNTAMYVIPICLIFRLNKLFYFTFFINVMGAFLAMIMPNTGDINILSTSSILFWLNHFNAFFMPVLLVALGIFKRPKIKEWIYSMIAFLVYFILILIINAWFSNYGSVDYFFLNSDFIVDKLGVWAEKTRDFIWSFKIGKLTFTFYPIYQSLFFLVYVFISLAMWFVYEQLFQMWDLAEDRRIREKEYRKMKKELEALLIGKGEDEPMSGTNIPCLELKNFSKKYGTNKHYSVDNVSLKVTGGQIFGFLGPNGAGKSTIIKSIVGIQTISKGSIEICGYDVEKQSVQAKKQIGFVPDHYALYENLTGREYINYIADLYEVSKEERDKRITKYVTSFNLEAAFDNQMKTYSHGMKQKITIMAALVHNPKVWILDEPLTGLDPNSIYQVKECMKEHAKEGNIVFFSSHIIDVVEKICDRIAIIKKGTLLEDVKVADLDRENISLEDFYLDAINSNVDKKELISDGDAT